jgi:hypothetical protein
LERRYTRKLGVEMNNNLRDKECFGAERGGLTKNNDYLLKLQSLISTRAEIKWPLDNAESIQPKILFTDVTTEHFISGLTNLIH